MSENWFCQTLIAVTFFIPIWLAVGFFERNYQIKPDIYLIWYFLGVAIATAALQGTSLKEIAPSWKIVSAMLLVGLVLGSAANMLLFRAVAKSPNPGLPIAVSNLTSAGVFIVATLLAWWIPKYFSQVKVDGWAFVGVILTIAGASLIAIRR